MDEQVLSRVCEIASDIFESDVNADSYTNRKRTSNDGKPEQRGYQCVAAEQLPYGEAAVLDVLQS